MRTVANAKLHQLQRRARVEGRVVQHYVPRDEIGGALPDVTVLSWLLVTVGCFLTGYFAGGRVGVGGVGMRT